MRTTSTRILHLMQIIIMLNIVTICFLFVGCSSCSTNPKTGSISGHVTLVNDTGDPQLDPVDFSGVTVAVYELAQLDTTLVRINNEYPQIGIPISQETEFDHRNYNPVTKVTTDAAGQFQISKISVGDYNLVFMKESWGVRYIFGVSVNSGAKVDIGEQPLYPTTYLAASVLQDITFRSQHHYLVNQDCSIMGNAVIEAQALISIAPTCNLRFYGNVTAAELTDFRLAWKVNSSIDIASISQAQIDADEYFASLVFYGSQNLIRNGIINHVGTAVSFVQVNGAISNMYINHFVTGMSLQQCSLSVDNVTIANGTNTGVQVISDNSQSNFSNCVLYRQNDAMNIYSALGFSISNSYFVENNYAIRPDRFSGTITHNAFERNNYDIFQFQVSTSTDISYNNFYHSNIWSIFPRRRAVIHNNNFFSTNGFFVWIRAGAVPYSYVDNDIDATNNYWAPSDIDQYIQDANDNGDYPNEPCPHYVVYLPKRSTKLPTAGIQ